MIDDDDCLEICLNIHFNYVVCIGLFRANHLQRICTQVCTAVKIFLISSTI